MDRNIMSGKKYTMYTYDEILSDFNTLSPEKQELVLPNLATPIGKIYRELVKWPQELQQMKQGMLTQLESGSLENINPNYHSYIKMLINNEQLTMSLIGQDIDGGSRKKIKTYRKHRKPKSHKKRKSGSRRKHRKTRR